MVTLDNLLDVNSQPSHPQDLGPRTVHSVDTMCLSCSSKAVFIDRMLPTQENDPVREHQVFCI